jgi:Homeodomain-like domain-containing protein
MSSTPHVPAGEPILGPLDRIPITDGAQTRVKIQDRVVREYATAMKEQLAEGGLRFPPVILFFDGSDYWLADGFHRVLAARLAALTEILAEVRPGTGRDALLLGITANSAHGLPRSSADKRKAVALLLADPEWRQWSDQEIASRCQVSPRTVNRMRRRASEALPQMQQRKVRRGDKIYEMTVASNSPPGPAATPATDALGIPLPETAANVFAALADFHEARALFDRLTGLLDRIAQGPAGEIYRRELIQTATEDGRAGYACPALRMARGKLVAAEPYCAYCPLCHQASPGRPRITCKACGGRGWTTRAAFEACPDRDRQPLLRLRSTSN